MNRRRRRNRRNATVATTSPTVGDIDTTGLWCNTCSLPSGVTAPLTVAGRPVGTLTWCYDTGAVDHDIDGLRSYP